MMSHQFMIEALIFPIPYLKAATPTLKVASGEITVLKKEETFLLSRG